MKKTKQKNQTKIRRKARIRAKIKGTSERPRLSVYRSLEHLYVQLVDDTKGRTLVSASDKEVKGGKTKTAQAYELGKLVAQKAAGQKITVVVFDKGAFKYHGRVKALADGAREAGLKI
ncbi:MAG: 50S ribosomal protein L18 [Patescibacteria group bacterium]